MEDDKRGFRRQLYKIGVFVFGSLSHEQANVMLVERRRITSFVGLVGRPVYFWELHRKMSSLHCGHVVGSFAAVGRISRGAEVVFSVVRVVPSPVVAAFPSGGLALKSVLLAGFTTQLSFAAGAFRGCSALSI